MHLRELGKPCRLMSQLLEDVELQRPRYYRPPIFLAVLEGTLNNAVVDIYQPLFTYLERILHV